MLLKKRSLTLFLALVLLIAIFASCGPRVQTPPVEPPQPPDIEDPYNDATTVASITPDWSYEIADRHAINDHTVGWLEVPGTNISDVVVRNPECRDNLYYLRRNFQREFYFNGIFYIDVRADLGPAREYLGVNTTIYGHAIVDDPNDARFDIMLGNLHKFRDPDFAREHPYIFFSMPEDNMVFEIIAVFFGNSSNPAFAYNGNPANPADFITIINETVLPRSLYHYDVELSPTDRFLTMSTCIYVVPGVTLQHYTVTQYRFAIMGRLVAPDAPLREYASFTINENQVIDPDGMWQG